MNWSKILLIVVVITVYLFVMNRTGIGKATIGAIVG